jgi:hypothetical protein
MIEVKIIDDETITVDEGDLFKFKQYYDSQAEHPRVSIKSAIATEGLSCNNAWRCNPTLKNLKGDLEGIFNKE